MTNFNGNLAKDWMRFRTPVAIIACYAASQAVMWSWTTLGTFIQFRCFVASTSLAAVFVAAWLFFNKWLADSTRYAGVIVCCFAAWFAMKAVRSDGYLGDATPNLTWTWSGRSPDEMGNATTETRIDLTISDTDSPGFLGQNRDATVREIRLSTDWMANPPKQLWRRSVGPAWSSFAVAGNVAITQEQRGDDEATVCYDLATGHERWVHLEARVKFNETYGGEGPRATPTIYAGRVYSMGATGILNCLDGATGERIWSRNILDDAGAENLPWAMAGSPLVFDDFVVVNPGGSDGRSVIAYDADDGKIKWQAGSGQAAYSSPSRATIGGIEQVVLLNGPALEGYEARTGRPMWSYAWEVNASMLTSITQPVFSGGNRIFISSGYGKGCALLDLKRAEGGLSMDEVWSPNRNLKSKMSSLVARDGFVYGLDEQVLVCLDLATGKRRWKAGRYGHGQLLLVDDVLLIQAESGEVALVQATPEDHRELTRFSPLSSKTWTVPVIAGNKLLVRNDREAACFELPLAP
jgi:outer membrane protein assembly factor BamB